MFTRSLISYLVDNFKDEIHHPWDNNSQHLTSCPAANDVLQDLLQSTLNLVTEPLPVRFGDLFQGLGLALQVLGDGLSQATTKCIPDLLGKGRLADLLEEDFNKLVDNPTPLNVVTTLECNIIILILFWEISKAAEESLFLRVSKLHNIVLILWDLRHIFIIICIHSSHGRFCCSSRSWGGFAFDESRVCDLDIAGIELHRWDDKGVDGDGGESKSEEGGGELHFECALIRRLGLDGEVGFESRLRGM
ncbi:hypothetical protein BDZ91DRAFT_722328 [Kalaharituber pfeilii]|nr:hypothetical protein BDZ91DRAFT_722328 [Kalaharituber pfeilii]